MSERFAADDDSRALKALDRLMSMLPPDCGCGELAQDGRLCEKHTAFLVVRRRITEPRAEPAPEAVAALWELLRRAERALTHLGACDAEKGCWPVSEDDAARHFPVCPRDLEHIRAALAAVDAGARPVGEIRVGVAALRELLQWLQRAASLTRCVCCRVLRDEHPEHEPWCLVPPASVAIDTIMQGVAIREDDVVRVLSIETYRVVAVDGDQVCYRSTDGRPEVYFAPLADLRRADGGTGREES